MFDNLSDKLNQIMKRVRGEVKFSESNIKEIIREVKLALLEADVHYRVVKDFTNSVREKILGKEVLESLSPSQHFIKIIHTEMVKVLGEKAEAIRFSTEPPSVIMLVGLQGAGKTTFAAKLALFLRKNGKSSYLVPADVYRPAAVHQLKVLAKSISNPVYDSNDKMEPADICKKAYQEARDSGFETLIIDTAGRLHINEELMDELKNLKRLLNPVEILYVADSMTGQDAVNSASQFNETLDLSGIILTKIDGDARGGAALSIKSVVGKPIKYVSTGEKLNDMEVFHPDRMASKILGMGDMLSLIEKIEDSFSENQAKKMQEKLKKASFTLQDFYDQLQQMKKLGPMNKIMEMIPGLSKMVNTRDKDFAVEEKELKKIEAMIQSMTPEERDHYKIIDKSRKIRITKGSGTSVADLNKLLKQFELSRKMMKKFMPMGRKSKMKDIMKYIQ